MTEHHAPAAVPRVVLVTSPGCHSCEDAREVLAALADRRRLELVTVTADSPEGRALVGAHRPALFPLVLLDGSFLSAGRLPRGKLARALGLARSVV